MPHPAPWIGFEHLVDLIQNRTVTVLSGAGVSTESGIPDYRGPETSETDHSPIRYEEFIGDKRTRRHYWARSAVGWPSFDAAEPNPGHEALAALETAGIVNGIITQNVDRLHQAAGSEQVIELHGTLAEVVCLNCGTITGRETVQHRLRKLNPNWSRRASSLAPDGDAEIPWAATQTHSVPTCRACDGVLKPNVVFFGENADPERVDAAGSLLGNADALLVVGSSLTVYSGFRFVRRARAADQPVAIVNLGTTRGTPLSTVHVDARTGELLPRLAGAMGVSVPESASTGPSVV